MHFPKISLQTCLVMLTAVLSLHSMAVPAQSGIETIELRPAPGLASAFDKGATSKDALVDKASHSLLAIYREYEAHLAQVGTEARGAATFRSRDTLARVADGYVVIDAVATDDAEVLAAELEGIGLKDTAVFGRMVSGLLPISAIPELDHIESLNFARPAYAVTHTGSVNSQGDIAMGSDQARALFWGKRRRGAGRYAVRQLQLPRWGLGRCREWRSPECDSRAGGGCLS